MRTGALKFKNPLGSDSISVTAYLPYLDESKSVGGTWSDANFIDGGLQITGLGTVATRANGKILSLNDSIVVSGKKFTNVTSTSVDIQYNQFISYVTIYSLKFYIAKGVGIVKFDILDDKGNLYLRQELTDYVLK